MSKILVEFDTETKEASASIDGKNIENFKGGEFYPCWDDTDGFCCQMRTMVEDEESGIKTVTHIMAAESVQGKASAGAVPSESFAGFVESKDTLDTKVLRDIVKFFGEE